MKGEGRKAIAHAIGEAREKGDLKENAEYDAAKEAQGMHEARIAELEGVIAMAKVIDDSMLDDSFVHILSTVRLKNLQTGREVSYTLVSATEADFKTGKINVDSPVGKGLLGKAVGDIADIQVPAGVMKLEVLEIKTEL
ncbi:UNVERIFIED_CONTAM: hypothetical protein GTU68_061110 [Idotea baltica]|nr:hypothetical protein [Idotea baltica]